MRKGAVLLCAANAVGGVVVGGCKTSARPPALGDAVSVEQPGGSASQLFSQGSEIPTSATESFTTAKDGEKRLYVHVMRGSGRSAGDLRSEAWYQVDGVGEAHAGEPRVMVTFELDGQGQLSLSAREEDRRLSVKKLEKPPDRATPSPLTEPDDDEDVDQDTE